MVEHKVIDPRIDDASGGTPKTPRTRKKGATEIRHAEIRKKDVDPLVQAMFDKAPDAGAIWSTADRNLWLATLISIFNVVYPYPTGEKARQARSVSAVTPVGHGEVFDLGPPTPGPQPERLRWKGQKPALSESPLLKPATTE